MSAKIVSRHTTATALPPRRIHIEQEPRGIAATAPRSLRLDAILNGQERNVDAASVLLEKVREIRARTLGDVPANEKAEAIPCRAGKLGAVEDRADVTHRLLCAIGEVVEDLLGI